MHSLSLQGAPNLKLSLSTASTGDSLYIISSKHPSVIDDKPEIWKHTSKLVIKVVILISRLTISLSSVFYLLPPPIHSVSMSVFLPVCLYLSQSLSHFQCFCLNISLCLSVSLSLSFSLFLSLSIYLCPSDPPPLSLLP